MTYLLGRRKQLAFCHSPNLKLKNSSLGPLQRNTCTLFPVTRPTHDLSIGVYVTINDTIGQGVWFFPVGALQLGILSMRFKTQSADRQQMGQVLANF